MQQTNKHTKYQQTNNRQKIKNTHIKYVVQLFAWRVCFDLLNKPVNLLILAFMLFDQKQTNKQTGPPCGLDFWHQTLGEFYVCSL